MPYQQSFKETNLDIDSVGCFFSHQTVDGDFFIQTTKGNHGTMAKEFISCFYTLFWYGNTILTYP